MITRSHELAGRFKRRGDAFAAVGIGVAFLASAIGFVTAAIDAAALGIATGILSAAAGALTSWMQRARYDSLKASNRDVAGASPEENSEMRFRLFVERCEEISAQAHDSNGPADSSR